MKIWLEKLISILNAGRCKKIMYTKESCHLSPTLGDCGVGKVACFGGASISISAFESLALTKKKETPFFKYSLLSCAKSCY